MMSDVWQSGEMPEEERARMDAYRRLAAAARRVGMPRERLVSLLRQVAHNQEATRRFLAEHVYGVPDDLLDDLLRVRMSTPEPEPRDDEA
jgi:hypothetical protein